MTVRTATARYRTGASQLAATFGGAFMRTIRRAAQAHLFVHGPRLFIAERQGGAAMDGLWSPC